MREEHFYYARDNKRFTDKDACIAHEDYLDKKEREAKKLAEDKAGRRTEIQKKTVELETLINRYVEDYDKFPTSKVTVIGYIRELENVLNGLKDVAAESSVHEALDDATFSMLLEEFLR